MVRERAPWLPSRMARKRFSHLPGLPGGSPIFTEVSMKRSVAKGSTTSSSAPSASAVSARMMSAPAGERAIDDAHIMRGEQLLGALADRSLGRLLRRLVELLAPEHVAGDDRDIARAELVHERLHVGIEHVVRAGGTAGWSLPWRRRRRPSPRALRPTPSWPRPLCRRSEALRQAWRAANSPRRRGRATGPACRRSAAP